MWLAVTACLFSLLACAYAPGASRICLHCDHVTDPSQCSGNFIKCHGHDEVCETEVRVENNQYVYKLGCKNIHECQHFLAPVVGRKRAGHPHGTIVCKQCCTDSMTCNQNLCGAYATTPTTTSTTAATQATTTINPTLCQDFEDDNFQCSDYDKYHLCDTVNGLEYELGHQRCQKHCGFCNRNGTLSNFVTKFEQPSTSAAATQPTTSLPETATSPPMTNPATMSTTTTQAITTQQMTTLPPATNPPSTNPPTTNPPATNPPPPATSTATATNFTVFVPIAANVTVGPVVMSTVRNITAGPATGNVTTVPVSKTTAVCRDFEDASFTCAEWASHGFCQDTTGQGHAIALLRCARYCGFCK